MCLRLDDMTYMYAEDELVSTDELQEQIAEFEDYVQSTDIAAMQSMFLYYYFGQPY